MEYITIENEVLCEVIEKRSRFIAAAKPVSTEADATEFLNSIRAKHWDASHNVYAYILRDNNIARFSDDGEPSGTAGLPVIEILKKQELTDIIVVITRYFGGTLLGTGGLIRAYSRSAQQAIQKAKRLKMQLCKDVKIVIDYTYIGKLKNEIEKFNVTTKKEEYTENVSFDLYIPIHSLDAFLKAVTEATLGQAKIETTDGEERYCESKE